MIRIAFGALLGAAALWVYQNRETLGFVVAHRQQLDAASNLVNDLKQLTGGTP